MYMGIRKIIQEEVNDFEWADEIPGTKDYGEYYKYFELIACYGVEPTTEECVEAYSHTVRIPRDDANELWGGHIGYLGGPGDEGEGIIDYVMENGLISSRELEEIIMFEGVIEIDKSDFGDLNESDDFDWIREIPENPLKFIEPETTLDNVERDEDNWPIQDGNGEGEIWLDVSNHSVEEKRTIIKNVKEFLGSIHWDNPDQWCFTEKIKSFLIHCGHEENHFFAQENHVCCMDMDYDTFISNELKEHPHKPIYDIPRVDGAIFLNSIIKESDDLKWVDDVVSYDGIRFKEINNRTAGEPFPPIYTIEDKGDDSVIITRNGKIINAVSRNGVEHYFSTGEWFMVESITESDDLDWMDHTFQLDESMLDELLKDCRDIKMASINRETGNPYARAEKPSITYLSRCETWWDRFSALPLDDDGRGRGEWFTEYNYKSGDVALIWSSNPKDNPNNIDIEKVTAITMPMTAILSSLNGDRRSGELWFIVGENNRPIYDLIPEEFKELIKTSYDDHFFGELNESEEDDFDWIRDQIPNLINELEFVLEGSKLRVHSWRTPNNNNIIDIYSKEYNEVIYRLGIDLEGLSSHKTRRPIITISDFYKAVKDRWGTTHNTENSKYPNALDDLETLLGDYTTKKINESEEDDLTWIDNIDPNEVPVDIYSISENQKFIFRHQDKLYDVTFIRVDTTEEGVEYGKFSGGPWGDFMTSNNRYQRWVRLGKLKSLYNINESDKDDLTWIDDTQAFDPRGKKIVIDFVNDPNWEGHSSYGGVKLFKNITNKLKKLGYDSDYLRITMQNVGYLFLEDEKYELETRGVSGMWKLSWDTINANINELDDIHEFDLMTATDFLGNF